MSVHPWRAFTERKLNKKVVEAFLTTRVLTNPKDSVKTTKFHLEQNNQRIASKQLNPAHHKVNEQQSKGVKLINN